jgi:carbon storage regulator
MLILTRRLGETLHLCDEITLTVTEVAGGQIRLGIEAPKQVAVHRKEIYERIKVESQSPLQSTGFIVRDRDSAMSTGEPRVQYKPRRRLST